MVTVMYNSHQCLIWLFPVVRGTPCRNLVSLKEAQYAYPNKSLISNCNVGRHIAGRRIFLRTSPRRRHRFGHDCSVHALQQRPLCVSSTRGNQQQFFGGSGLFRELTGPDDRSPGNDPWYHGPQPFSRCARGHSLQRKRSHTFLGPDADSPQNDPERLALT